MEEYFQDSYKEQYDKYCSDFTESESQSSNFYQNLSKSNIKI